MFLFRIHIRPQGGAADMQTTFDYCLRNNLLGVGWRTTSGEHTKDWDTYLKEASGEHDNLQVCSYIQKWVSAGDLVWTRDPRGCYYLARVVSGWEYWTSDEAKEKDIDIANIFRCELQRINPDLVPGKVVACFRAKRTIQEIADATAREYSKYLWNSLSGQSVYELDRTVCSDVFALFDAEETEDLVFLYLQHKGWRVVPHSRKADTMSFEYTAVDPQTGEVALTQVKTGHSALNCDDYSDYRQRIFLFQPQGRYFGSPAPHITCITRDEMQEFLHEARPWLPATLRHKQDLALRIAGAQTCTLTT